jgi:hypothetical protein
MNESLALAEAAFRCATANSANAPHLAHVPQGVSFFPLGELVQQNSRRGQSNATSLIAFGLMR